MQLFITSGISTPQLPHSLTPTMLTLTYSLMMHLFCPTTVQQKLMLCYADVRDCHHSLTRNLPNDIFQAHPLIRNLPFCPLGMPIMPLHLKVSWICVPARWHELVSVEPAFGHHVNAPKTWLTTKQQHLQFSKDTISGTRVNIMTEDKPQLDAPLGTQEYCDLFVHRKVSEWCAELERLSSFAEVQPHAAYAAVTPGLTGK